jgi:hypothetical protein
MIKDKKESRGKELKGNKQTHEGRRYYNTISMQVSKPQTRFFRLFLPFTFNVADTMICSQARSVPHDLLLCPPIQPIYIHPHSILYR